MAKHWKSFVKKEKAPKEENAAIENIASLLSPTGKKSDKSLEDAAAFNPNLKSLIDEQKQLEDQMAELTGKKKESNTDRRYEHEIKTIDQKKKEEAEAAEKLQKRKESHRKKQDDRWDVTPSFTPKKREVSSVPPISKKRKTTKANTGLLQPTKASKPAARIPNIQRKPEQSIVSKKKKTATTLLEFGQKIQQTKQKVDDFTKRPKKSVAKVVQKSIRKPVSKPQKAATLTTQKSKRQSQTLLKNAEKRKVTVALEKKKKAAETVATTVKKGKEKLNSFVNNTAKRKEVQTIQSVAKKASKVLDTFDSATKKVSKVNDTFQTVRHTGNELQTGVEKIKSITKSPELQTFSKKVSKGMGIVNKVGKKLQKVDSVFNTANKKLEKANNVANLFEKKLNAVDFISGKDAATKHGFDFDFIQQKQTKKEETTRFDVGNKKLNVAIDVIKTAQNVKKGIDILNEVKKQKDSFSF
ncbi:hypothetical protein KORDIASMS9_03132 [Kordia sp. SMS9]|uniref:hypothetical protein n=1 Tax=Kordia sp. SMS9 TaxID=2282170 RepID=UPI000E0DF11F|nr:hypothetical protein [Kordia sp. SMS9]AXG70882.1 hypothetical protein KORDIASMS9_03132 [Kordia sp. SMS9]